MTARSNVAMELGLHNSIAIAMQSRDMSAANIAANAWFPVC